MILRPDGTHSLHAMCDADFAGTWSAKYANHRSTALSRTGFIIFYSGCPLIWHSKLQKEIALSTCEAEYIALSQCARAIIPLRRLIDDLSSKFKDPRLGSDGLPTSTFLHLLAPLLFEKITLFVLSLPMTETNIDPAANIYQLNGIIL